MHFGWSALTATEQAASATGWDDLTAALTTVSTLLLVAVTALLAWVTHKLREAAEGSNRIQGQQTAILESQQRTQEAQVRLAEKIHELSTRQFTADAIPVLVLMNEERLDQNPFIQFQTVDRDDGVSYTAQVAITNVGRAPCLKLSGIISGADGVHLESRLAVLRPDIPGEASAGSSRQRQGLEFNMVADDFLACKAQHMNISLSLTYETILGESRSYSYAVGGMQESDRGFRLHLKEHRDDSNA